MYAYFDYEKVKKPQQIMWKKIRIRRVRTKLSMVWVRYNNGNPLANPRRQYWRQICLPGQQQAFFCSVLLICTKTDRAFFTFFSRHATTLVTKSGYCITSKTIQYVPFIGQWYFTDLQIKCSLIKVAKSQKAFLISFWNWCPLIFVSA